MKSVLYELGGKSLEAAKELEAIVNTAYSENPPLQLGLLSDIHASWQAFSSRLIQDVNAIRPEILDLTGLNSPCIDVRVATHAFPRAYQTYPCIYRSPERETRYFMYSPEDYKGRYFTPEDAKKIIGKEAKAIGQLLFAGGWDDGAPLLNRPEFGVEMPGDISYSTKFAAAVNAMQTDRPTSMRKNFIAGCKSQELVDDFKKRKAEHEAASTAVFNELRRIASVISTEMTGNADEYDTSLSGSYKGSHGANMTFSFDLKTKLTGSQVSVPEHPYFYMKKAEFGGYEIVPREDTVEGSVFSDLLLSVPPMPYLSEYEELISDFIYEPTDIERMIGVDGRVPQLIEIGGLQFISYNSDERVVSDYCPPGAKPVSSELYNWLQRDRSDFNMKIMPPPMPDQLAQEYAALTLNNLFLKPDMRPQP
ncbi:MAG: hypothetical protein DI586_10530 [Micavibrio aeruginosavorus]|uniref:Uncharacterized protein n=1 Tax=Micavibrio aeruginosavorus TaxID=349221 RepID=A0A2W5FFY9_9BACT|nr:MAG: hypothetical protein DI586_10530 [Micavibrio aeruginosavorus]